MIDRWFDLSRHQTNVGREALAGVTTFLTMAYILVIQPQVLSGQGTGQPTGLDPGAVLLATCVASALATLVMGIWARYPVALAPGMGQNFFFVAMVGALASAGVTDPWQTALGVIFIAGVLFLVLSLAGVREIILDALSESIRSAIAVGIGLFITLIGLRNGGVVADHPGTLMHLNAKGLLSPDSIVFWAGFVVMAGLTVNRVRGGIVVGIIVAAAVSAGLGKIQIPEQILGFPDFETPAAFQMDIVTALTSRICWPFIFMFLFMDMFDTLGTLVGVTQQAGLMENGKLPRARRALTADAAGTVVGASLGTSTITSYIESAAGVEQGGRTGLTAVVVALLFLASLVLSPWIIAVGAYAPITAGALVLVGAMMMQGVRHIDWNDPTEALPSFLIIIGIPFFNSIADGLALGLIGYPLFKLLSGRIREVRVIMFLLAAMLLAYFLLVRVGIG